VILRLAIVVAALGAALVPLPRWLVESLYSERAYLALQRHLTPLSDRVPFAVFDALILAAVAWLAVAGVGFIRRWRKRGVVRAALHLVLRVAAAAALVYLAFLVVWGLNYRREPLTRRLAFESERVAGDAASRLARAAARRATDLRSQLAGSGGRAREGKPGAAVLDGPSWAGAAALITPAFDSVQRQLAPVDPAVGGRPKRSMLGYYFERAGVDGMTAPFFLEVLVSPAVLPLERPFVTAHEWAHLAGYADEAEANFVGWLVCLQGPPAAEYSGQLALLMHLLGALPREESARLARTLSPGVRADMQAVVARDARTSPRVRAASWRVYDRYLKANRVEKGVASYGAALELMLGTRFGEGWVPTRRPR
jgi:hypothetical protein